MRALISLLTLLAGATDAKQTFENDCLYCHSDNVIVKRRMRPSQWRGIVAKMQARAPLLISRRDADVIVRYIVRELKLVPPRATPRPAETEAPPEPEETVEETPAPPPPTAPAPTPAVPTPLVSVPAPLPEEDTEAESVAPKLLVERCSKCHSLFRVFTKLDSAATAEATIERMRRKTGSGISAHEADLLKRFARSRSAH